MHELVMHELVKYELVKNVAAGAGITEDQALKATDLVFAFLQEELPALSASGQDGPLVPNESGGSAARQLAARLGFSFNPR